MNRKLRFNDDGSYTWISEYADCYMAGRILEETTFLDASKKNEMIYPDGSRAACKVNEDGSVTETIYRVSYEGLEKRVITGEKTDHPDGTVYTACKWGSTHPNGSYLYTNMEKTEHSDGSSQTICRLTNQEGEQVWLITEEVDSSGKVTVTSDGAGAAVTLQGTYPVLKPVGGELDKLNFTELQVGERVYRILSRYRKTHIISISSVWKPFSILNHLHEHCWLNGANGWIYHLSLEPMICCMMRRHSRSLSVESQVNLGMEHY